MDQLINTQAALQSEANCDALFDFKWIVELCPATPPFLPAFSLRQQMVTFALLRQLYWQIKFLALTCWLLMVSATAQELKFNRDVLPILSDNCFYCHGPDAGKREAGLRLDAREDAISYGAINIDKPSESMILERINATDKDIVMPPPEAHKVLSIEDKATLTRWLEEGAVYEPHWSYITPVRPTVPSVAGALTNNPIDAFVAAKLSESGLSMSEPAERATLVRRLSLDLIGLPPTPAELAAVVNDPSSDAITKWIDELLARPQYGQRMAIGWLDVVRYADTVGFHGDQNMNSWAYRDYVIDSINSNKPFDQFTIEQLAGDLLPNPTTEQLTATCFNRLNMMTREGGAQPKEYLAKYAADRVRTIGTAFLGSTFGCAECHDHKFDPISARDFYSMSAFFADIKQWGVYSDYVYTPNKDLEGFTNDYPFPPELEVPSNYLLDQLQDLQQLKSTVISQTTDLLQTDTNLQKQFVAWLDETQRYLRQFREAWQTINLVEASSKNVTVTADGLISLIDKAKTKDSKVISATFDAKNIAAIRIELIRQTATSDEIAAELSKLPFGRIKFKPTFIVRRIDGTSVAVKMEHAWASEFKNQYDSGSLVDGIQSGWQMPEQTISASIDSIWCPAAAIELAATDLLEIGFDGPLDADLRISVSPIATSSPMVGLFDSQLLETFAKTKDATPQLAAVEAFIASTNAVAEIRNQLQSIAQKIRDCHDGKTPVLVVERVDPPTVRILPRGNWQDDSGEIVKPALPHFLPNDGKANDKSSNARPVESELTRLDLARWLVSPENPLTSRVVMNRLWASLFGSGLSERLDDFGAQGAAPSHPNLLDWLAVEFRESGWDQKHMVRLMVSSRAYQQSSQRSKVAAELDADSRLLSHHLPRRLQAELIRDNVLSVAGLLNLTPGGPSSKPYQPAGYYAALQFPDRPYVAESDSLQYRRGVYTHWQRTFLHPMLANFGAPSREDCIAARVASNTPQQALTLLNDPSMVEAAKMFANRLLRSNSNNEARLQEGFQLIMARHPSDAETLSLLELLEQLKVIYQRDRDDAQRLLQIGNARCDKNLDVVELAAWTNICRVLINLHESITVY